MSRFNRYIKKVNYNDITFDSQQELDYYLLLLERLEIGEIRALETHKSFELIPSYKINGKVVKAITYEADFVFYDNVLGIYRVIDVKGFADDVFKLKQKMFDYHCGYMFPRGLEVMKYSKSTGWVDYNAYKKARASYKKRLVDEKNAYKSRLEQNQKQAIRDTKLYERYVNLLNKQNNAKMTSNERNRLLELETYFKDKVIITDKGVKNE